MSTQAPSAPNARSPVEEIAKKRMFRVLLGILCALPELILITIIGQVLGGEVRAAANFFVAVVVMCFLLTYAVAAIQYTFSGKPTDASPDAAPSQDRSLFSFFAERFRYFMAESKN
jgi:hypothetical protein